MLVVPLPLHGLQVLLALPQWGQHPVGVPDLQRPDDENRAQVVYNSFMNEGERANLCTECGACLDKCPQMVEIPDWLFRAHEALCGA